MPQELLFTPNIEELGGMSVQAAIRLSLAASGLPDDEIMAAMGWSRSTGNRIISNGDYWPSLPTLPRYCEVVGNFVVPYWVIANAHIVVGSFPEMDAPSLLAYVRKLMKEISDVLEESEKALADTKVDPAEARRVERKLEGVFSVTVPMLARLQATINAARGV